MFFNDIYKRINFKLELHGCGGSASDTLILSISSQLNVEYTTFDNFKINHIWQLFSISGRKRIEKQRDKKVAAVQNSQFDSYEFELKAII